MTIAADPTVLRLASLRLRMAAGRLETHRRGEWTPVTRADLLRWSARWPAGSDPSPWPWLAEHGIRRPVQSGATRSRAERVAAGEREVSAWLTAEQGEVLDELIASGRWGDRAAEVIRAGIQALAEKL